MSFDLGCVGIATGAHCTIGSAGIHAMFDQLLTEASAVDAMLCNGSPVHFIAGGRLLRQLPILQFLQVFLQ